MHITLEHAYVHIRTRKHIHLLTLTMQQIEIIVCGYLLQARKPGRCRVADVKTDATVPSGYVAPSAANFYLSARWLSDSVPRTIARFVVSCENLKHR